MMTGSRMLKTALAVLVLLTATGEALARGRRRRDYDTVELSTVRENPTAFIGKRIAFDCFFAGLGRIYQPFQTPFVAEQYLNFHVWEPGTALWSNTARRDAYLFNYIPRDLDKQVDYVMRCRMYESLRIFGRVTVVYAEHPWFEVEDVEPGSMRSISEVGLKHILVGIRSLKKEQFKMAQESFKDALETGLPSSAQDYAQWELGEAYYKLGRFAEAADAFREGARYAEGDPAILRRLGQALSRAADQEKRAAKNRLSQALEYLRKARRLEPANPDSHAEIGWVLAKLGQPREGIRHVKRSLAIEAKASSYRILAVIYIRIGKLAEAEAAFINAINQNPDDPRNHKPLADMYVNQNRLEDAEREYSNVITVTEKTADPEGHLLRAGARMKLGNYEGARKDYEAARRKEGVSVDAIIGLASVHMVLKQWTRAAEFISEAKRLSPDDVRVHVASAEIYQAKGDYAAALKHYDNILKKMAKKIKGPLDSVHYGRGICLWKKDKPDLKGAAAAFRQALRTAPDNTEYLADLARVLMESSQFRKAVQELEKIKALMPNDGPSRLLLADAKAEADDVNGAIEELERLVVDVPDLAEAKNNLAYLLAEYGGKDRLSEAESLATAAYNADPSDPDFQDTLGWIKYLRGEQEDARSYIEPASINLTTPDAAYHMAVLDQDEDDIEAKDNVEEGIRRINEMPSRGKVTRDLLDKLTRLAPKVGASTRPGPRGGAP